MKSTILLMKLTNSMITAFLLGTALFTFLLPVNVNAKTIKVVSDGSWAVYDTLGTTCYGFAKNVCLNPNAPSPCPTDAIQYGYPFNGWNVNLSNIPGAKWIWAPNVSGTTANSNNAEFIFNRWFQLCGNPLRGTISLAADNYAEVRLNGKLVLSSANFSALTSVTITASDLRPGLNLIEIRAKNTFSPADNCSSGEYRCNPAGIVFGGSFEDDLNMYPKCSGGIDAGDVKFVDINMNGQKCTQVSVCQCLGPTLARWFLITTICPTQPLPCTGTNGQVFSSGQLETRPCPPGQNGSVVRTCQNGNWQITSNTCATIPVTCTGSNGATFLPGQSETLQCGCEGTQTRTCQSNGNWSATSGCIIPTSQAGEMCGTKEKGECRTCPPGTTCKPKLTRVCQGAGIFRHCDYIQTTDYFCLPN